MSSIEELKLRIRTSEIHIAECADGLARMKDQLADLTACCPECKTSFAESPKRKPNDCICELCLDDERNRQARLRAAEAENDLSDEERAAKGRRMEAQKAFVYLINP